MDIDVPNLFRGLDEHFETARLNILWATAKQHLPDSKLQSLFQDLLIHDKEEVAVKRLKAKGEDKDGVQETAIEEKLMDVINTHNLLKECAGSDLLDLMKKYDEFVDETMNCARSLCRKQGYVSLWAKILRSGFSIDELEALKKEILHHHNQSEVAYEIILGHFQFLKENNLTLSDILEDKEVTDSRSESYRKDIHDWRVKINKMEELGKDNTNFSKRIERTIKYKRSPEPKGIDLWIKEYKKKLRNKRSEEFMREMGLLEPVIAFIIRESNDEDD